MKTKEQIIEEYGNIELSFSSYYKYSFNYSYSKDDLEIYGSFNRIMEKKPKSKKPRKNICGVEIKFGRCVIPGCRREHTK